MENFQLDNCVTVTASGGQGDLIYNITEVDPPQAETNFIIQDPSTGVISCYSDGDVQEDYAVLLVEVTDSDGRTDNAVVLLQIDVSTTTTEPPGRQFTVRLRHIHDTVRIA